jgi:hypothetical protein
VLLPDPAFGRGDGDRPWPPRHVDRSVGGRRRTVWAFVATLRASGMRRRAPRTRSARSLTPTRSCFPKELLAATYFLSTIDTTITKRSPIASTGGSCVTVQI